MVTPVGERECVWVSWIAFKCRFPVRMKVSARVKVRIIVNVRVRVSGAVSTSVRIRAED